MNVLLADDVFTRYRPSRADDGHGWASEGPLEPIGQVTGCLQLGRAHVDNQFQGEGFGQNEPHFLAMGTLYLNAEVEPGDRIGDDVGDLWLVDEVRIAQDHTGAGLDCWVAHVTALDMETD